MLVAAHDVFLYVTIYQFNVTKIYSIRRKTFEEMYVFNNLKKMYLTRFLDTISCLMYKQWSSHRLLNFQSEPS